MMNVSNAYSDQLRQRLIQLRTEKGVSARDMSLSIGQSESYINKIENKKSLPSMDVFFTICDYLQVCPKDFFIEENVQEASKLVMEMSRLDKTILRRLLALVESLPKK